VIKLLTASISPRPFLWKPLRSPEGERGLFLLNTASGGGRKKQWLRSPLRIPREGGRAYYYKMDYIFFLNKTKKRLNY
jgi:hypothetical protein